MALIESYKAEAALASTAETASTESTAAETAAAMKEVTTTLGG